MGGGLGGHVQPLQGITWSSSTVILDPKTLIFFMSHEAIGSHLVCLSVFVTSFSSDFPS